MEEAYFLEYLLLYSAILVRSTIARSAHITFVIFLVSFWLPYQCKNARLEFVVDLLQFFV